MACILVFTHNYAFMNVNVDSLIYLLIIDMIRL